MAPVHPPRARGAGTPKCPVTPKPISAARYTSARFVLNLTNDDDDRLTPEGSSPTPTKDDEGPPTAPEGSQPSSGTKPTNLAKAADGPAPKVSPAGSGTKPRTPKARKRKGESPAPDPQAQDGRPVHDLPSQKKQKTANQGPKAAATDSSPSSSPAKDNSPQAIYSRYADARLAWFESQLPHARTDGQYREAMGLPLRYRKKDYMWCRGWKQMTGHCTTPTEPREWTEEEMTAYLDWNRAEDARIQVIVDKKMEGGLRGRVGKGLGYLFEMMEEDSAPVHHFSSQKITRYAPSPQNSLF